MRGYISGWGDHQFFQGGGIKKRTLFQIHRKKNCGVDGSSEQKKHYFLLLGKGIPKLENKEKRQLFQFFHS